MEKIKMLVLILIGNAILALGVSAFLLPNGFIAGGATGVAIILNHYFSLEISVCVMIVNVVMFVTGFIFLGKKFALTTIISSITYPLVLGVFTKVTFLQTLSNDPFLSSVMAGAMTGVGIGLVIKAGASTGGMDIPLLILNKRKGISIGVAMYAMDTLLLLLQASFSNSNSILYGIVVVIVTSVVINQVLLFGEKQMQILVVSKYSEEIKKELLHTMDIGVTLLNIETGLSQESQKAVLSVCDNRHINIVKKKILEIDPLSFMTINTVVEVHGKGYTVER